MTSTMIAGSATTGVERSSGAHVTTTSGIAEISSVRICAPSIRTVQPRWARARSSARNTFALMMVCGIEAGAIRRGRPSTNSHRSGWRACHASNSATVRGQSSSSAALAIIPPAIRDAILARTPRRVHASMALIRRRPSDASSILCDGTRGAEPRDGSLGPGARARRDRLAGSCRLRVGEGPEGGSGGDGRQSRSRHAAAATSPPGRSTPSWRAFPTCRAG